MSTLAAVVNEFYHKFVLNMLVKLSRDYWISGTFILAYETHYGAPYYSIEFLRALIIKIWEKIIENKFAENHTASRKSYS